MKILFINTFDILGGATRAAYRLHRGLIESGIDSLMLVQYKTIDNYTVIEPNSRGQKFITAVRNRLDGLPVKRYKNKAQMLFSPAWVPFSNIIRRINTIDPDIVHLHWIAGGMLRIEDIGKIRRPVVWTLHDMWAFTGGCHYDNNCGKYIKQCGLCPVLGSHRNKDLSSRIFIRKKKTYKRIKNLTVVGPSNWIADCARSSTLLKPFNIVTIPNPIDTEIFCPVDKQSARRILGLPIEKKIVLFGASNAIKDPRKGFKQLSEALFRLTRKDAEFAIFGAGKPKYPHPFGFPTHYFGILNDDISLKILYSAADVMVVPSLQESFGLTALESMSCGTPVVCFNTHGLIDIVEHRKTGYLATPFDTDDLAEGINWVLDNPDFENLCKNARKKVLNEFKMTKVVQRYKELYEKILTEK